MQCCCVAMGLPMMCRSRGKRISGRILPAAASGLPAHGLCEQPETSRREFGTVEPSWLQQACLEKPTGSRSGPVERLPDLFPRSAGGVVSKNL